MSVAQPDAASAEPHRFESIEGAFAALESPLLIYALRLLPNRAAAEDIVQEAFMKLHGQFKEVREPRRWLYRTVHNLALNYRRKTDRLVPLEPTASPGSAGEGSGHAGHRETADPDLLPDEQIVRWEGIGLVRLSLGALDERSREVVRLKFEENLSYRDISERTGLSVSNVGYLLHHALKTLAAELTRSGLLS
jgi:RNA polymerase sigma-70 factor (ECF subfamily)